MPALFAYMIAVGFLLGGGYGALNWLAAPEPVKVAARVKAKPPQRSEAAAETPLAATSPNPTDKNEKAAPDSDKTVTTSNDQPLPVTRPVAASPSSPAEDSSAATQQEIRSAHAEASVEQQSPAQPVASLPGAVETPPLPRATAKLAASAPSAPLIKTAKRSHARQASRQPERPLAKGRLALMTLRTIQYPDGRRVSQLLPYRGGGRALAFAPDE
jgi:hypothetical protein